MRTLVLLTLAFVPVAAAQRADPVLPPGAISIINEDRFGSRTAVCVDTGAENLRRGPRTIRATEVWAGQSSRLRKLNTGAGACDPAWSPDGRRLAIIDAQGLWFFPADSLDGSLRVESKVPYGELPEFTYRAFSHPEWSPDGALVALLVTNGGTSWVEVFEVASGRLFYTSPPEITTFNWGGSARDLKAGTLDIHLPARR